MAAIQIGQPSYGLLDTNIPAQAAMAPIKGAGAVNALIAQNLQNEASQFEMQNALAEQEAYKRSTNLGEVQQNLLQRGLGKQAVAIGKTMADTQKAQGDVLKSRIEQSRYALEGVNTPEDYLRWHIANHQDPVMGQWLASRGITPEKSMQNIQKALQTPGGFDRLLMESKIGSEKTLEQINREQQLAISKANLGVSQGHLALAQQNQASPEAQALISKAILDGRLDPNKVNSRNRNVIAATLMADPNANLRQLGEEAAGGLAGARSIGTQEANVAMAASEARKMINLAEQYSGKVDRTQYPNINAISNAVAKGTGDANIVQLDAALNSLVNVYARAINPKGVATVADKKHAREIIDRNYSAGQLSAAFQVMDQEMAAAQASGKEARKVLRGGKTELSGEDKAAADWARANPNNPKAAKILQHLGL